MSLSFLPIPASGVPSAVLLWPELTYGLLVLCAVVGCAALAVVVGKVAADGRRAKVVWPRVVSRAVSSQRKKALARG